MKALKHRLSGALLTVIVFFVAGMALPEVKAGTAEQAAQITFIEADKLRSEQLEASSWKAVEKYRQAALLFEVHAELRRATVALRKAAELLQLLGNSSEAVACYHQALGLNKRTGDLVERGKIYNGLAFTYFIAGDVKEAHEYALKALRTANAIRNREIEAAALSNLGEALYGLGEIAKARQQQERSLALWRELNDPRGQAIAIVALGWYYSTLGEPEKALRSFTEGLSLARLVNDPGVETTALIALCNIKRRVGNHQEALESYQAAQKIAERIGDQTSQATILGGLGSTHFAMGDKRQALKYIGEATQLMERHGKKWGTAEGKLELGRIHHSLGENDAALESLAEALSLFKSLEMRRLESAALRAIGLVHESLGDTAKALESHLAALKLTKPGEDQREEAYTLTNIGRIYEALKDYERASRYYARALPLSQRSDDPEGETLVRYNLAHLERDRGNLGEARRQVEAALEIIESQRANVSSPDLRASYFANMRNAYELYINILMLLHKENPNIGLDKQAFSVSEKARARSFHELLLEARTNFRKGVDPALVSKEKQLNETLNEKAQLHVQLLAGKRNDEAAEVSKQVDALVSELTNVRDQIRRASPQLATLELPQLLSISEVQKRVLDDDTILLEYVLGDDRSYVWVVTKTTDFVYELSSRSEVEASVDRLYKLLTAAQAIYGESPATRKEREEKAAAEIPGETLLLSRLVLGPLAGKLDKKKLLIVVDGALQYIPFAWLTNPDSGTPLIATHEIGYTPSASTHALLQAEASKRGPRINSVAVIADPVFEADDPRLNSSSRATRASTTNTTEIRQLLRDAGISRDGVEIPRLMASGTEADGIMAVAPWRTGLKAVGFAANRDRVLGSELANYRIVHFATHGIIHERPELSGIVLSLFDDHGRSQNGFLRLHDIYNLHLPADLVVLSACSTGLGKDVRGEGLIGLTRGFMYAGASGVIASLWKVDDDATAELMKHFYAGLFKRNLSPAAALREAQVKLSQHKRWQSPYYWAGFVLQGQPSQSEKFIEPFPSRTQIALLASLSGILLVAAPILITRRRRR
jgi:CHAT domain-containing protein